MKALAAGLMAVAAAASSAAVAAPAQEGRSAVEVEIVRKGDSWSATYRFDRESQGWTFPRSALIEEQGQPWRPLTWIPRTPGLSWSREGGKDVLRAEAGKVPREVRFDFRPAPLMVQADYVPALTFAGGAVALFSDHFLVSPLEAPGEQGAGQSAPVTMRFRDEAGEVLAQGKRTREARFEGESQTYVLFGETGAIETEHLTAIVDPALPEWIRSQLADFLPKAIALHSQGLGDPGLDGRLMVMISWAGSGKSGHSQQGSVLPGLIILRMMGSALLEPDPSILESNRWLLAHETAHFWLGQAVRQQSTEESWITEGGADLLAIRALASTDPGFDAASHLQRSVDDCAELTIRRGIASALDRGEHRAFYACGTIFALIAEAQAGGSFPAFLRPLIESNREDGLVNREEWLAALDRLSGDPTLGRDIGLLIDQGSDDPKRLIGSLLERSGVTLAPATNKVAGRS